MYQTLAYSYHPAPVRSASPPYFGDLSPLVPHRSRVKQRATSFEHRPSGAQGIGSRGPSGGTRWASFWPAFAPTPLCPICQAVEIRRAGSDSQSAPMPGSDAFLGFMTPHSICSRSGPEPTPVRCDRLSARALGPPCRGGGLAFHIG